MMSGEQAPKVLPQYHEVAGIRVCKGFSGDLMKTALEYEARPDDLFIVTYPKCGTTWTQQLVYLIMSGGIPPENLKQFHAKSPFLELEGKERVASMPRPIAIKTHLVFDRQPYHPTAKYIYVVRNPKDVCVSFYHHTVNLAGYKFSDGKFEDFFELFMRGEVDDGDYYDHILSWWEHKDDPNVLFLVYEDMKKDIRASVKKAAQFMGKEYIEMIEADPQTMENIVKYSTVDFMKKTMNAEMEALFSLPSEALPKEMMAAYAVFGMASKPPEERKLHFIRKGQVNDWKNIMTPEQSQRVVDKFREKAKSNGLETLWADLQWV